LPAGPFGEPGCPIFGASSTIFGVGEMNTLGKHGAIRNDTSWKNWLCRAGPGTNVTRRSAGRRA